MESFGNLCCMDFGALNIFKSKKSKGFIQPKADYLPKNLTFVNLKKMLRHILHAFTVMILFCGALMPGFSNQLNKLPSLVEHYRHHLEHEGYATITEFIYLHYGESSSHKTAEDHQDLPFFQMSHTSLVALTHEFAAYELQAPDAPKPHEGFYPQVFYFYNEAGGIFQPPRLA